MIKSFRIVAVLCALGPAVFAQAPVVKKKKPSIPSWGTVGKEMKLLTTTEGFWNLYVDNEKPAQKFYVEVRNTGRPSRLWATGC